MTAKCWPVYREICILLCSYRACKLIHSFWKEIAISVSVTTLIKEFCFWEFIPRNIKIL